MNVIILASGKNAPEINKVDIKNDIIVAVNNAWRATDRWTYWCHTSDDVDLRADVTFKEHQREVVHNEYSKSTIKYGPLNETCMTITLACSYWVLDILKPDNIYYFAADMNYKPDEYGGTHFYGKGLDIIKRGISDPDMYINYYKNKHPNIIQKLYTEFEINANNQGCKVHNISTDVNSRLPFNRVEYTGDRS